MKKLLRKLRGLYSEPFPVWRTTPIDSEYVWDSAHDHPLMEGEYCGREGYSFVAYPETRFIGKVWKVKPRQVWMEFLHINSEPRWVSTKKLSRVVIKRNLALDIEVTPLQLVTHFWDECFDIIPFEEEN